MALLEVWKTFEDNHGSPDEVKKVEGMMPIVSKRRVVDQETGQTVEGMYFLLLLCLCSTSISLFNQTGIWYSPTTNGNPTLRHSSSCKWRMHGGSSRAQAKQAREEWVRVSCLDSRLLLPSLLMMRQVQTKKQVDVIRVWYIFYGPTRDRENSL